MSTRVRQTDDTVLEGLSKQKHFGVYGNDEVVRAILFESFQSAVHSLVMCMAYRVMCRALETRPLGHTGTRGLYLFANYREFGWRLVLACGKKTHHMAYCITFIVKLVTHFIKMQYHTVSLGTRRIIIKSIQQLFDA